MLQGTDGTATRGSNGGNNVGAASVASQKFLDDLRAAPVGRSSPTGAQATSGRFASPERLSSTWLRQESPICLRNHWDATLADAGWRETSVSA